MFELERFDKETGMPVEPPFYLLKDGAMINDTVFRSPNDDQYAVLGTETFEKCKCRLITPRDIEFRRLKAQLDGFPNALHWHSQQVDDLWTVSQVQSFEDWYNNSKFIGYIFPSSQVVPKTYEQFQSKRNELAKAQQDFERRITPIKLKAINTQQIPF
jgi:hypothetical protein